jgi:hypothetical protein
VKEWEQMGKRGFEKKRKRQREGKKENSSIFVIHEVGENEIQSRSEE